nr:hypothetical protein Iba_chr01eCG8710 [Ipomoea batatas]
MNHAASICGCESERKQRIACRKCHRAPLLLHLGFAQGCGNRRIRLVRRIAATDKKVAFGAGWDQRRRWLWLSPAMVPSKHESKVCCWTEGVPSVNIKTGGGSLHPPPAHTTPPPPVPVN